MATYNDAVAVGLVASLAHPGGNVTGSTFFAPELIARVELHPIEVREPGEYAGAFSAWSNWPIDALVVLDHAQFIAASISDASAR